jgi:hypothetical protein
VLTRLRHDSFVGGDHEQRDVDAARAGHHRPDERFVSRHVHNPDRTQAIQFE